MASSKEFLSFIREQLSELPEIAFRPMMGEYVLYYRDKVIGGVYDDRFLVKPAAAAVSLMPGAAFELPYEDGRPMLMVRDVENRDFLKKLVEATYDDLPPPKKKK